MKKFYLTLLLISIFSFDLLSQQIEVGQGTLISVFSPLCRSRDYCVYEVIYNSSDIALSGNITDFAFERFDGQDTLDIDSVTIYMKQSNQTILSDTTFSTANYTQVYSGKFPNNSGVGWREVQLDVPFNYDASSNLMVLAVKGYQPAVANTPVAVRWYYTNTGTNQARRYYDNVMIDATTYMEAINFSSNARLTFASVGVAEIRGEQLLVFPNPANDKLFVTVPTNESSATISIYDLNGRMVQSKISDVANGRMSEDISLQSLAPGIYMLNVQAGEKIFRERVVVGKD